ncbi:MAG: flagellar basal body L-ring protein FlgH [Fimbriimonas ginsengisoli]|uniref:Flagellar basal body L-ring protein FlgH n=1 Tax=Fimbriimonas ginsengisoli TaxID=1005039 RepID=A0A931PSS6_FIMGI|nr:flagellar basal body L-ring protein FlgH [Fimbriimonas ginsengisoli]
MNIRYALVASLALVASAFAAAQEENPGSLWPSGYRNPLLDRTAHREGDVITILISETSTASFTATTTTSKTDKTDVPHINIPVLGNLFSVLGIGATSTTAGNGASTQEGKLTARLTAVVKKVFANGTMLVEGSRSVRTNKDTQVFRLSGIVRREDIRPDNTVLSESLANAEIHADGKGQISDRQRKGILTRLLDWLF